MIRTLIFLAFLLQTISISAQKNYKYEIVENWKNNMTVYSILNKNGDTIKKLDPDIYIVTLRPKFNNFAIFLMKGKEGWSAIDLDENYLFQVQTRFPWEPYPDFLIENRIRIVGENGLIGFADSLGKIVIEPRFEKVSEFNNGFAIFESGCKEIHNEQEGEHSAFNSKCKKTGYIDKNGEVKGLEKVSFKEMKNKINWNGKQY